MIIATRVRILRRLNYPLMGSILILGGVLTVPDLNNYLTEVQRTVGLGLLAVFVLSWFLIQRTLYRWLLTALNRTELSNDGTFDLLYNNSPVAHLTLDQSGGIIDYNPKAVHLLQTDIKSLRGRSFISLCAPEFDSSILAQKMRAGLIISELELPLNPVAGTIVWASMSVYSLRRRGEVLVTLIDITEQKKIDTAKSEFVALATHQLRTPITAIRYAAELLSKRLREGESEKNAAYLDKINRNVGRMLALIDDFLNVSKLQMGTFATEISNVNVSTFLTEILDEFGDRTTKQNITVSRQENPPDQTLETDPRLLNIILNNLVSNAVKYTPANGKVAVIFTSTGSAVTFEIIDSGIGIPIADIPQLFGKFYRASNARTLQSEGTGLGLYVVDQAVKQLHGTIEVQSNIDAGTHFTVTLPVSASS